MVHNLQKIFMVKKIILIIIIKNIEKKIKIIRIIITIIIIKRKIIKEIKIVFIIII